MVQEHEENAEVDKLLCMQRELQISSTTIKKTTERIETERCKMQELFSTRNSVHTSKQRALLEMVYNHILPKRLSNSSRPLNELYETTTYSRFWAAITTRSTRSRSGENPGGLNQST